MTLVSAWHNNVPMQHYCVVIKPQLSTDQQSPGAQGSLAGTRWNSPWMPAVSEIVTGAGDQPNWSEPTVVVTVAAAAKVVQGGLWLAAGWLAASLKKKTTRRVKEFILVVLVHLAAAVTRLQTRPGFDWRLPQLSRCVTAGRQLEPHPLKKSERCFTISL